MTYHTWAEHPPIHSSIHPTEGTQAGASGKKLPQLAKGPASNSAQVSSQYISLWHCYACHTHLRSTKVHCTVLTRPIDRGIIPHLIAHHFYFNNYVSTSNFNNTEDLLLVLKDFCSGLKNWNIQLVNFRVRLFLPLKYYSANFFKYSYYLKDSTQKLITRRLCIFTLLHCFCFSILVCNNEMPDSSVL